jgi:hypothetical protein
MAIGFAAIHRTIGQVANLLQWLLARHILLPSTALQQKVLGTFTVVLAIAVREMPKQKIMVAAEIL